MHTLGIPKLLGAVKCFHKKTLECIKLTEVKGLFKSEFLVSRAKNIEPSPALRKKIKVLCLEDSPPWHIMRT